MFHVKHTRLPLLYAERGKLASSDSKPLAFALRVIDNAVTMAWN